MGMEINTTKAKASRRGELEAVIERGLQTFVEVGNAIREIRDSELYRDEYSGFEEYCRERWGWSIRRSQQMMIAAETASVVDTNHGSPLPSERHARELAPLAKEDPDAARELWTELSGNDELTAADIRQAVRERSEYKVYLGNLPPQTRTALEQADENYDKHRNLLRNSNQLNHLANIADKRGDEVAAEVAEKVLTEEGSSTFTAYEAVKGEVGPEPPNLPSPHMTPDEKTYYRIIREWRELRKRDQGEAAAQAKSPKDVEHAIKEADKIIGWFEGYKAALRSRGQELEPGNLRRIQ